MSQRPSAAAELFLFFTLLVFALLALAVFAPSPAAVAAPDTQIVLSPVADALVTSQIADENYGKADTLSVSLESTDEVGVNYHVRTALKFDLSSLPAGVEIDSAMLEVNQIASGGASSVLVWAFPITSTWTETGASGITWSNQPDFDTTRAASATLDATNGYKSWDVTAFARDWYAGAGHGVLLHGPEPSGPVYTRLFDSYDSDGSRPRLTVTYHTPSPPVPDLVMEDLSTEPNPAFAAEQVALIARIYNDGSQPYANVPVRFYVDGVQIAAETLPSLEANSSANVVAETAFAETGAYKVSATVNPAGTLPDADPNNNTDSLFQAVVIEKNPIWSKPDLALEGLVFDPARPGAGKQVEVSAEILNIGRPDISAVLVALVVDGSPVDEQIVTDIPSGNSASVTLHWPSSEPGRHLVNLVIDPEMTLEERSKANNEIGGWLRVSGAAGAKPDIEVRAIRIPEESLQASADHRETLPLEIELYNAGYVGVNNLPVEILVDGKSTTQFTVPRIDPGQVSDTPIPVPDPGLGHHIITARLDPDSSLSLDLLQRDWAQGFTFPTPDFKPALYSSAGAAQLSGLWEFIGPRPMKGEYLGVTYFHNGRVDGFDVSSDAKIIVAGTVGGGIWRSENYGNTWEPITDPLNQPEFTRVALDPKDPNIIYGLSGSSYSIHKSLDGGKSWSLFTHSLSGAGNTNFRTMLVRYESGANTVTLYVADNNGLWVWQGKPKATSALPSSWHHVWQQTRNAHPNVTSAVTDLHITSESAPQVYLGAYRDAVYRTSLSGLLTAVAQNKTPAWSALESGMSHSDQIRFFVDSSKAKSDRVFVLVTRSGECGEGLGTSLSLYRLEGGASKWTHVGDPTDITKTDHICGIRYVDFLKVNPAKPNILYVGGVPGYRSTDGGKSWPKSNKIPYVHDDYKWAAFDPSDPSVVFFSSDGGIYRCTNDGASCDSLNYDLETGMFFDIAVAGQQNRLIIGGTQDNGTQRYDGALQWEYIRGGDGKFCAIDPTNNDIMYSQHQYAIDTWRSADGGKNWGAANNGLPGIDQYLGVPFLALHPNKPSTLLITAGVKGSSAQVYRTTDSGKNWAPIGPAPASTRVAIFRILIDGPNDRYYAGSAGEIWAVKGSNAGANSWTRIYDDPTQGWTHEIVMDPDDPDTLYALFTGWGTGAKRVIELKRTGGAWPGTAANWQATPIAGGLPNVGVFGGAGGATRGLALEPNAGNAAVLYVGTTRGIYQGRRETGSNTWTWTLDSCGMPRTYITDIAVHSSGTWLAAATYGRGVYTRNAGGTIRAPDKYEKPVRNDTFTDAAVLPNMVLPSSPLYPALAVENLNLDRGDDVDFFRVKMPPYDPNACLPANDPSLSQPNVFQCSLGIAISAPDTPDPFEFELYRSDGTFYLGPSAKSGFGVTIERPYDAFKDGVLILRIRDLTGCRAKYSLHFWYNEWVAVKDVPDLLYDPPLFNRVVPEFGDFPWVFPADPGLIDRGFVEELGELPEQRVTFPWQTGGDFATTIAVGGGRDLNLTLYNDQNQAIATGKALASSADGSVTIKGIDYANLPAGWYALGFHGGTFPTFFRVDAGGMNERTLLPIINSR